MSVYKKLPLTVDQQIELLKQKKLIINDEVHAREWLSHVSYYRLKHYTLSFKNINDDNNFIPNTTFNQVVDLYLFDRKLRLVIFDGLEAIEVAMKTMISNVLSQTYGAHWYLEPMHFSERFEFDKLIKTIQDECYDPDEQALKVYRMVYSEPALPPSWMAMELLTFGTISKIFEHLTTRLEKQQICQHFNLPDNILISWLHCFTHLRNRCAHHARFVYRSVKHEPILPSRRKHIFLTEVDDVVRSSLYAALCCMQRLIEKINPASTFKTDLLALIAKSPNINYTRMGFTSNWRSEELWVL